MKNNWWKNLKFKIIAWSFVPTVIILSGVAWFTFYSYQKVLGDLAIKQYPELVQPKATEFSDAFRGLINPVSVPIILDIDINPDLPLEVRAQNILDQAQGLDNFDGGVYFLDQNGVVYKSWPEASTLIGQDWSDTPHFRSINEKPNLTAFSDLITIEPSGKKIFCFAQAMVGHSWDEFAGGYYLCYTVYPATKNSYYETMLNLNLGTNFRVLDRNQNVIFAPVPSDMGKDLSMEAYIQQLNNDGEQSGRFRIGNEDKVVCYISLPGGPTNQRSWFVLSDQNWKEIIRPSLPYRQFLLILLSLGVMVPVMVTAYGVRHITDPIQKLIQASKLVTAGQFHHRIEVNTGDEIESLAEQFNFMSKKLDDSYSSLEKTVADRTRELAILNSIISVVSHSLNLQEILDVALNNTIEQMGFDMGGAYKFEQDPITVLLLAHYGFDPISAIDLLNLYKISDNTDQAVFPDIVSFIGVDEIREEDLHRNFSSFGFGLLIYIPLITKGRKLGFFILGKNEATQPSIEELSLLNSIGKQVGVAMENALLYEQAEQSAIVAERNRLARELHDAVTQTLFSANLIADVTPRIWKRNPIEGMQNLEELRQLTRGALAEMRTILLEMRPESLEQVDIKSLLTQLSDAFVGRVRVPVSLKIQGNCELTQDVKIVFYRIAQEALNNIAKHSGARQIDLILECQPGHIKMRITDDGLGFDPAKLSPGHLGISIMRERANSIGARLIIESQLNLGTTIDLDWRSERRD